VRPRVLLAWSSGKDSAMALHVLRGRGEVEVVACDGFVFADLLPAPAAP